MVKELKAFEEDLIQMVQNIKMRKKSNPFLKTLKKEIRKISDQKDLMIPADKTTNKYLYRILTLSQRFVNCARMRSTTLS